VDANLTACASQYPSTFGWHNDWVQVEKRDAMKKIYLLFFILFLAHVVTAQARRRSPNVGIGFQVVQPTGQYGTLYEGYLIGVSGTFSAPVQRTPFEFGAGFSWNSMGSQDEDVSAYIGDDVHGDEIHTPGTMRIRSNNYRYMGLARFRPFVGRFQVYADALGGLESFVTKTDLQLDNPGYSEVRDSEVQHRNLTINYGWALGVRIQLSPGVFLEGRFEKLEGGLARYVDPNSIEINHENNTLDFETRQSQTDKFTYQIGVAFQF